MIVWEEEQEEERTETWDRKNSKLVIITGFHCIAFNKISIVQFNQ